MDLTCILNPVNCITSTVDGWWASIPLEWFLWGAFGAGLILGAILGKWGVAALLAALALFAAFNARNTPDDHEQIPADHKDAFAPRTKPKVAVPKKRPKGETAADRWGQ